MGEKWLTNDYIQTARKLTPIFRKNHQPPCKDIIPRNPLNKNCMIYVDDEAFAFETRKDMETGSYVVFKHYNRFGLQMHIGSKSKPSKTEYVFFLPLVTLNYLHLHQLHSQQIPLPLFR